MQTHKRCPTCQLVKTADKFGIRSTGKYLRGQCKSCENVNKKKWADRNPEKVKILNRISGYRRLGINISLDDYDIMYKAQNGKCAICENPTGNSKSYRLHVDHNHVTGQIRKLLCSKCNVGIGLFGEDINLLLKTIEYLKYYE